MGMSFLVGKVMDRRLTSKAALNLRPFPTCPELLGQLSEILGPLVPGELSSEPVRSVGGLSQVMFAESRYVNIPSFSDSACQTRIRK